MAVGIVAGYEDSLFGYRILVNMDIGHMFRTKMCIRDSLCRQPADLVRRQAHQLLQSFGDFQKYRNIFFIAYLFIEFQGRDGL